MQNTPSLNPSMSKSYTSDYFSILQVKDIYTTQTSNALRLGLQETKDYSNLYLIHSTCYFPENGTIKTRLGYELPDEIAGLKDVIEPIFSILRPTVHFTVNHVVEAHSDYRKKHDNSYIIIEPFNQVADQVVGGYLEDVFSIGTYELTDQATILVPEALQHEPRTKENLANLSNNIKVIFYSGNAAKATNLWLQENHASKITSFIDDPNMPQFIQKIDSDKYISSKSLMDSLGKNFVSHDLTPTAQIENSIAGRICTNKPPFIELIKQSGYRSACNLIKEYTQATRSVYKLTSSQVEFINLYEESILRALTIFNNSVSFDDLSLNFSFDSELIMQFDSKIALDRQIDNHQTAHELSEISKLPFVAYYRANCNTVVDAAFRLEPHHANHSQIAQILSLMLNLNFTISKQTKHTYVVLREVNNPVIARSIYNVAHQPIKPN